METILDAYCFILYLRFMIPFTGQMYFNPAFGFLVRITEPPIRFVRHMLFNWPSRLLPLFAMAGVFLLKVLWLIAEVKTVTYAGARPAVSAVIAKGFDGTISFFFMVYFVSSALYCIESFRNAYDNISRILKDLVQPIARVSGRYFEKDSAKAASAFFSVVITALIFKLLIANSFLAAETGKFTFVAGSVYGALISTLADIIKVFRVYTMLIFIRIIISWFTVSYQNILFAFLFNVTEPYLSIFRKFGLFAGPIDFSPMVAIFVIWAATGVLQRLILLVSGVI
ncbi:MAG: YggT family protein [Candidatus Aureabacteria bacterium]|nr:YggT family protein [Candidatus Auribacterota bacterium]